MEHSSHTRSFPSYAAAAASGFDVYKRKALLDPALFELIVNQYVTKGQASGECSKDYTSMRAKDLERTNSFPQKKQKIALQKHPFLRSGYKALQETDRDRIVHMQGPTGKAKHGNSSKSTQDIPRWHDSSAGNSAESMCDSDSSELSLGSTATSRSSSRTRNYEAISVEAKSQSLSHTITELQIGSNYHMPSTSVAQGSYQKAWSTPRSMLDQNAAISRCSNRVETRVNQATIFEGDRSDPYKSGGGGFRQDGNGSDKKHSPSTESGMASGSSPHSSPSAMKTDDPSSDSSDSQTSSTASKSSAADKNESNSQSGNKLEHLVKNQVLRSDPDVAELFLRTVAGKLEFASHDDMEQPADCTGLSLLHLLELAGSNKTQECPGLVTYTSSSDSSSSSSVSPDAGAAPSSSGGELSGSGGSALTRDNSASDGNPTQLLKGQKTSTKSGGSQPPKFYPLRCVHNALSPEVFSVNHETQERFRPCAGPGWSSIQHLKEHMLSHHTKKVKKLNELQCSDCQDKFQSKEELKSHKEDVDCPIRCRYCPQTFITKAKRTDHQNEMHQEQEAHLKFLEIDEGMSKKLKENLKAYSDSVKNGPKGKGRANPELDAWVEANSPRYMVGRSAKTTPNAKLELGQWYTIFKTLAPSKEILEHPFYDYGIIPHSDYIEERIILINDALIESRIIIHGPPPSDIPLQRDWYRAVLRETLQLAAKTVCVPAERHVNVSPANEGTRQRVAQNPTYGMAMMPESQDPQMNYMSNGPSVLHPSAYIPNHRQQRGTPGDALPMTNDMGLDSSWGCIYTNENMTDGNVSSLDPSYNLNYSEDMHMGIGHPGTDVLSDWQEQHGQ